MASAARTRPHAMPAQVSRRNYCAVGTYLHYICSSTSVIIYTAHIQILPHLYVSEGSYPHYAYYMSRQRQQVPEVALKTGKKSSYEKLQVQVGFRSSQSWFQEFTEMQR
eukprot:3502932-Pleurochrysis_carterae.AAC.1